MLKNFTMSLVAALAVVLVGTQSVSAPAGRAPMLLAAKEARKVAATSELTFYPYADCYPTRAIAIGSGLWQIECIDDVNCDHISQGSGRCDPKSVNWGTYRTWSCACFYPDGSSGFTHDRIICEPLVISYPEYDVVECKGWCHHDGTPEDVFPSIERCKSSITFSGNAAYCCP